MFQVATGVTLDANWRWIHGKDGYENCYTGNTWDQGYCPDAATCTENCLLGRTTPQYYWCSCVTLFLSNVFHISPFIFISISPNSFTLLGNHCLKTNKKVVTNTINNNIRGSEPV